MPDKSAPPVVSAKTTVTTVTVEHGKPDTEAAEHVLTASDAASTAAELSHLKVKTTYSTGALGTTTKEMALGSKYYGIAANVGKMGEALGHAGFLGGAVLDAVAVNSGQESRTTAAVHTVIGAVALRIPQVGAASIVASVGFSAGKAIDRIPMGGGRTVGENLTLGIQRVIAPSSVEPR
jgi:hypothetical protein